MRLMRSKQGETFKSISIKNHVEIFGFHRFLSFAISRIESECPQELCFSAVPRM